MKKKDQDKKKKAEYNRKYSAANKKKIAEQRSKYREANPEKVAELLRRSREAQNTKYKEDLAHREMKKAASRSWRKDPANRPKPKQRHCKGCGRCVGKSKYRCEQCATERRKERDNARNIKRLQDPAYKERRREVAKKNYKEDPAHREKIAEANRKSRADPARMEKRNAHLRERRKTDPAWAIQCRLSSRLATILKGVGCRKPASTMQIVGCTRDELIAHLASKFKQGMTMENQGSYWHVDHIMPCAAFDHNIPAQVRTCWHYTNLQPLEAKENMRKGCKITVPQMSLPLSTKKDAEK
tara:strand:+ start:464 stop:1357 length:894 start_codon:yes stop_codon:yes gene_type:complete